MNLSLSFCVYDVKITSDIMPHVEIDLDQQIAQDLSHLDQDAFFIKNGSIHRAQIAQCLAKKYILLPQQLEEASQDTHLLLAINKEKFTILDSYEYEIQSCINNKSQITGFGKKVILQENANKRIAGIAMARLAFRAFPIEKEVNKLPVIKGINKWCDMQEAVQFEKSKQENETETSKTNFKKIINMHSNTVLYENLKKMENQLREKHKENKANPKEHSSFFNHFSRYIKKNKTSANIPKQSVTETQEAATKKTDQLDFHTLWCTVRINHVQSHSHDIDRGNRFRYFKQKPCSDPDEQGDTINCEHYEMQREDFFSRNGTCSESFT